MDITKTRAELVTRALRKLLVVGSGQSPEDEDTELVDEVVDATLADLASRRVVYIANEDAIDVAVFEWVADILSDNVAQDFGKSRNPAMVEYAEAKLKAITATTPTREVLAVDYF